MLACIVNLRESGGGGGGLSGFPLVSGSLKHFVEQHLVGL